MKRCRAFWWLVSSHCEENAEGQSPHLNGRLTECLVWRCILSRDLYGASKPHKSHWWYFLSLALSMSWMSMRWRGRSTGLKTKTQGIPSLSSEMGAFLFLMLRNRSLKSLFINNLLTEATGLWISFSLTSSSFIKTTLCSFRMCSFLASSFKNFSLQIRHGNL